MKTGALLRIGGAFSFLALNLYRKLALIGGFKTQDILLDTLEGYKTQVGKYFGVDPTVWELQGRFPEFTTYVISFVVS